MYREMTPTQITDWKIACEVRDLETSNLFQRIASKSTAPLEAFWNAKKLENDDKGLADPNRGQYTVESRDDRHDKSELVPVAMCDTLSDFVEHALQSSDMTWRLIDDFGDVMLVLTTGSNVNVRYQAEGENR